MQRNDIHHTLPWVASALTGLLLFTQPTANAAPNQPSPTATSPAQNGTPAPQAIDYNKPVVIPTAYPTPSQTPVPVEAQPAQLGPNKQAPKRPQPATPTPAPTTPPPDNGPRTTLTLQQSYRLAIDNSPRLNELRAKVLEQDARVDEAFSYAYPSFNITGNVTHNIPQVSTVQNNVHVVAVPSDAHTVNLNINQAILTFGRLKWSTAIAQLNKKSSQEDFRREAELIFDNVATAYQDAILAAQNVDIVQERVHALEAQLRDSQNLFRRGTVARFDVLRAEAELSNYQQQLLAAQNNARLAADRLLSQLGVRLGDTVELAPNPLPGEPPRDVDKGTALALERRPGIGIIQWMLESAKANVSYQSSQNKPRLDFFTTSYQRNELLTQAGEAFLAGLQVTIPIWDGGLTTARIGEAVHVVEEISAQLENERRTVRLDVREAYNNLKNAWDKKDFTQKAKEQAAEAFRVAQIRYKAGVSTQVELLSAQASYSDTEFAEAQNWHDYQLAWAHWKRVISEEYPAYVPGPLLRERANDGTPPDGQGPTTQLPVLKVNGAPSQRPANP